MLNWFLFGVLKMFKIFWLILTAHHYCISICFTHLFPNFMTIFFFSFYASCWICCLYKSIGNTTASLFWHKHSTIIICNNGDLSWHLSYFVQLIDGSQIFVFFLVWMKNLIVIYLLVYLKKMSVILNYITMNSCVIVRKEL